MEKPNLDYINQLSNGDQVFKDKIITIIQNELKSEIQTYENHIKEIDKKNAAEIVHKLKHKISIFGLEKSYYIAEEFENNLKNNSTHLQSDFEAILKLMQEYVEQL